MDSFAMKINKISCIYSPLLLLALVAGCGGGDGGGSTSVSPKFLASATAVPADYKSIVQQLYISYFGRPADTGGLSSFEAQLAALGGPTDIQGMDRAYRTNAGIKALVDSFGASAESAALYSGDNATFVTAIYNNVLNRPPNPEGLAFWVDALDKGSLSRGNASLSIMAGALANTSVQGQLDSAIVTKKVNAGRDFTAALADAQVNGYSGKAAAAQARAMLASVTATTDIATFQTTIATLVNNLAAMSSAGRTTTFSGTVAIGSGAPGADITLSDINGPFGTTVSREDGTFHFPFVDGIARKLKPPFKLNAKFQVAGKVVDLGSVSLDESGGNIAVNITPWTDIIRKAYDYPASGNSNSVEGLPSNPGKLSQIISGMKDMAGVLLPKNMNDFIKDEVKPGINEYDDLIARTRFLSSGDTAVLTDVRGTTMATRTFSSLMSGASDASDTATVSKLEADRAIKARTESSEPVATSTKLSAPANVVATKTGTLSWNISWDNVTGASRYFVYQNSGSAPLAAAGKFDYLGSNQAPQPMVLTSRNLTSAHSEVDAAGTYYWVVVALLDDEPSNAAYVGSPSAPVSLDFASTSGLTCFQNKDAKYCKNASDHIEGELVLYFNSGAIKATEMYKDGLLDGPYAVYFENGALALEANYKNNKQIGTEKRYASDSYKIISATTYSDGFPVLQIGYYNISGFDNAGNKASETVYAKNDGSISRVSYTSFCPLGTLFAGEVQTTTNYAISPSVARQNHWSCYYP